MKNSENNFSAEMTAQWQRVERWLRLNVPAWLGPGSGTVFNPPIEQQSLDALENHLQQELPNQLKIFLQIHNGFQKGEYPLPMRATRPTKWRIMPASEITDEWDLLKSISMNNPFPYTVRTVGPVLPEWWSKSWIPIADCGMGDVICIDTAPPHGGAAGQLILYEHDFEERKVLCPSLLDWLHQCADDLENGDYIYIAGVGLCHKDDEPTEKLK